MLHKRSDIDDLTDAIARLSKDVSRYEFPSQATDRRMVEEIIEREIEPTTVPPWGEAKPPPELAEAMLKPIPHGTEAPGEALRRRADVATEDAIRGREPIELEPMGPNERRVVHEYLRDRPEVETYSEGDEPNRYVVIAPLIEG